MSTQKPSADTPEADKAATSTQQDRPAGDRPATTREPRGAADPPQSIAKDDAFHLLQNARRRAVLRYLLAHPDQEQFRMRDLAEEVAAWEHDTTVRQLTSAERQRVYIALYQSHLTKLDDYGVIEYNQDRGVVEPTPLLAALAPFLADGLHADTQHLTCEPTADGDASAERDRQTGLASTITRLF